MQELAEQPDGAVLQIPMGWRNSFGVLGTERTQAQYYMSAHEKPILSGNTSRNPAIKFDYFERLPLVQAITRQEFGEAPSSETLAAAQAQADDLMTLWGVRYLMTLPPVPGRLPYADHWAESQQLALDLVPHSAEPIIDDGDIQIWEVEPGAPLPLDLDFGARNTDAWRGEGWGTDEADVGGASGIWATAERAHLLFRSEDETSRTLTLRAQPFTWPDAPPQTLAILLNDHRLDEVTMSPGWQEYTFELAPQVGINHLWLAFGRVDSPRAVLGQAMIGSTGVQSPVNIDIHSFDEAFITLYDAEGSETPASFGRRGYNVTVLDPDTGEILAARRLRHRRQQLRSRAPDRLSERTTGRADRAPGHPRRRRRIHLARSDSRTPAPRLRHHRPSRTSGQAHALAGIVSAAPGTAAETIDPADAFLRIDGDFRTLAAAFDWLKIE